MPVAQFGTVCAPASSSTDWSAPLVKLGASFTKSTVMPAVVWAVLKGLPPPFWELSATPPLAKAFWSQARKVRPLATVPLKSALGTKRTRVIASDASRRALLLETALNGVQLVPLSNENCQAPLVLST